MKSFILLTVLLSTLTLPLGTVADTKTEPVQPVTVTAPPNEPLGKTKSSDDCD